MRRKFEVFINREKYIIGEPTVGLYWLSLKDPNGFILELFSEFNDKTPSKLSGEQFINLIKEIFEIDNLLKEEVLEKEIDINKRKINNFHILVGQFMKFFGNGYADTMKIPFETFQKMLKDIKKISGEEETTKLFEDNSTPDKKGIKNLLSNFK